VGRVRAGRAACLPVRWGGALSGGHLSDARGHFLFLLHSSGRSVFMEPAGGPERGGHSYANARRSAPEAALQWPGGNNSASV